MTDLCRLIFWTLVDLMRARATLEAEIWVLRQEERTFATHPERQFMEHLRGKDWVKGTTLPTSRLIASLQKKGWIEQQLQGPKSRVFYRMTDAGLAALKARVPTQESWVQSVNVGGLKAKRK